MTAPRIDHLPLIDEIVELSEAGILKAEVRLDPTTDPFLKQHLFKNRPILPAVISISAVAQAASLLGNDSQQVTAIQNVELIEPLKFHTDRPLNAHVSVVPGTRGLECVVCADFHNRSGKLVQANRPYMRANVELSHQPIPRSSPKAAVPSNEFAEFNYPEDVILYHGDVFRALKDYVVEDNHVWSKIEALDVNKLAGLREGETWLIPASVIDAAFYTCGIHVREYIPHVAKIPKSIHRLLLGRFPCTGEQLMAFATCRQLEEKRGVYDFTIYGEDGSVIVEAEGYQGVFVPRGGD